MSNFELVNFINYDINKNNKLISKLNSAKGSYILFNNFDINTNNPDYIKDMNFENVIHIDLDELITDIQSSFTNITEIQDQFVRDINRSYMTFNGQYVKNPSNVLDYLESKYRNTNPTLEKEILMLSTQALFAIPFFIIQKGVEKKDLYLGELTSTNPKYKYIDKKYKIDILDGVLRLEKYMRLFTITKQSDDSTKYVVKINIDIDLLNERSFVLTFNFIK